MVSIVLTLGGDDPASPPPEALPVPYVSEFCLFAAAFVAAFAHGEAAIERLRTGVRRLAAWRRKDRRAR